MKIHLLIIALFLASGCAMNRPVCHIPESSFDARAYDLCFLRNATDDIAAPDVQTCYEELKKLPDTCATRTRLKRERCERLGWSNSEAEQESCLRSMRTEGLLVNGCEYPFSADCAERVN